VPSPGQARFALFALTLTYVVSFIDRQSISLLAEPIRRDLGLTDMQLGLLQGFAFATVYVVAGLPFGRAADQFHRRNIIVLGVAAWSVMTSLCGVVRSFGALLVCRAGVGIGEAALSPSAYSLMSDYFPPRQLPAAMATYNLAASIGSGLAFVLGGVILAVAGSSQALHVPLLQDVRPWQVTFLLLGALGLLAVGLLLLVAEPPRRDQDTGAAGTVNVADTARFLRGHVSSVVMLVLGLSLLGLVSYAMMTWYATMIVRTFDEPVSRTGVLLGPVLIAGSLIGNLGGAWCAMKLGDRGVAVPYVAWTFIAAVGSTVLGVITPLMPSLALTYAATGLLSVLMNSWMGPAMAGLHLAIPNRMRAQLTAITLLCTNLVGLGLGPTAVAALTQYVFADPEALRYSLAIVSAIAGSLAAYVLACSRRHFLTSGLVTVA
jgi:MFS family permease